MLCTIQESKADGNCKNHIYEHVCDVRIEIINDQETKGMTLIFRESGGHVRLVKAWSDGNDNKPRVKIIKLNKGSNVV
jgi:hypothetical protein